MGKKQLPEVPQVNLWAEFEKAGRPQSEFRQYEKTRGLEILQEYAETLGLEAEDLDEQVHEAKCEEASRINNGGIDGQLEYLLEGDSLDSLLITLRNVAREKARA